MGTEGTTSSSGRGDSSPASVELTMTPMQAKALATLVSRSARHGCGLDATRVATAASKAADIVAASIASGSEEEGALIALQLAATVDAAAIATAEETALAAA